jgi:hypothetical protein
VQSTAWRDDDSGDDDTVSPGRDSVAGSYSATTFLVTQGDISADLLQLGGGITLDLANDGSVTGHIFVPNGNQDGSDLDLDLNGTWTLDGAIVRFDMPDANTFIRDIPFTAGANTLSAERNSGGTRIQLVLTKNSQ